MSGSAAVKNTTSTRHWTGRAPSRGPGQGGNGFADIGLSLLTSHAPSTSPLLPLSCRPQGRPPHPYLAPEFPLSFAIYELHHFSCSFLIPYRAILFLLCPVSCGILRWIPYEQRLRREFLGKWFLLLLWALRAMTVVAHVLMKERIIALLPMSIRLTRGDGRASRERVTEFPVLWCQISHENETNFSLV